MTQTIATLQQHLNNVTVALSTTTEMLSKIIPDETFMEKGMLSGESDPVTSMLMMILRSQVQINNSLVERVKEETNDAELNQHMAKINEIREKAKSHGR